MKHVRGFTLVSIKKHLFLYEFCNWEYNKRKTTFILKIVLKKFETGFKSNFNQLFYKFKLWLILVLAPTVKNITQKSNYRNITHMLLLCNWISYPLLNIGYYHTLHTKECIQLDKGWSNDTKSDIFSFDCYQRWITFYNYQVSFNNPIVTWWITLKIMMSS